MQRILSAFLFFLFIGIPSFAAQAQPESESPYSSQAFDPVANPEWHESPFLWLGLVAVLLILFLLLRRKRRSRKFMGPRD